MQTVPECTRSWFGWREFLSLSRDVLATYSDWRQRFGRVVGLRFGPQRHVILYQPELIGQVLKKNASSFRRYPQAMRVLRQWNGDSVLIAEGQPWLRQRRLLAPAFLPQHLDRYLSTMVECVEQAFTAPTPIDVMPAMVNLTLRIFCATVFDLRDERDLSGLAGSLLHLGQAAMVELFLPAPLPPWLPLPLVRRKRRAIATLKQFVESLIQARSEKPGADLLSILLQASQTGDRLTSAQLRDEVMTLLLAGHDTTAAGLSWMLSLLANHPQVAARVAAEGEQLSHTGLAGLRYTEQVVHETLRLYPPAPGVFLREALQDVQADPYHLPRGSLVHMPSWVVHHDPEFFPDPFRFDPDRFQPNPVPSRPDFAYFPFGGGPRICLGQSFALMEMAIVAAVLLRRFRLRMDQAPPRTDLRFSLWPTSPLRIFLEPR